MEENPGLAEAREHARLLIEITGDGVPTEGERRLQRLRLKRVNATYAVSGGHFISRSRDGRSFAASILHMSGAQPTTEIVIEPDGVGEQASRLHIASAVLGLSGKALWDDIDGYSTARLLARTARLVHFGDVLSTTSSDQFPSTALTYSTKLINDIYTILQGSLAASGYGGSEQGIVLKMPTPGAPGEIEMRNIDAVLPPKLHKAIVGLMPYALNVHAPDLNNVLRILPLNLVVSLKGADAISMLRLTAHTQSLLKTDMQGLLLRPPE